MELAVGRIVKSHGVRGEVVVDVRTDSPEERFAPGTRLVGRPGRGASRGPAPAAADREFVVAAARAHSGRLLVVLEGVTDRDTADALRGTTLLVDSAELPAPDDPDEFHDHQLVGLRALDPEGAELGTVADVVHTAAGELLSLTVPTADDGTREVLVPFVLAIVPAVDLTAGTLTVDPPEGLFDPELQ